MLVKKKSVAKSWLTYGKEEIMSRIGKKIITIPAGVTVTKEGNKLTVTGPKGTLSREVYSKLAVAISENEIAITNNGKTKDDNAQWGLYRQLIANMVEGVSKGFEKKLNINGVGYKLAKNGDNVTMNIGFSHPVEIIAIPGITLDCDGKSTLSVKGIDKEIVGQFAAKVRAIKPVEPYHAYGISYSDEKIRRKEIKSGKK